MSRTLLPQVPGSHATEFLIDEWNQLGGGVLVALPQLVE
jgi:hypothetical protein